jgi:hypothetical protein
MGAEVVRGAKGCGQMGVRKGGPPFGGSLGRGCWLTTLLKKQRWILGNRLTRLLLCWLWFSSASLIGESASRRMTLAGDGMSRKRKIAKCLLQFTNASGHQTRWSGGDIQFTMLWLHPAMPSPFHYNYEAFLHSPVSSFIPMIGTSRRNEAQQANVPLFGRPNQSPILPLVRLGAY